MTGMTTTIYVTYFYPGAFMPEESTHEVPERAPQRIATEAPESVFAFTLHERMSAIMPKDDGEEVRLLGPRINQSGRYYIDAEKMTAADVKALPGDHRILLDNMRCNGWDPILRCRTGNFQPLEDGDVVVSSGSTAEAR